MSRRRGWKKGDYLVVDQESGFVRYASEVTTDYYGVIKDKKQADEAHPQDFVYAKADPYPVDITTGPPLIPDTSQSVVGFSVGNTTLPTVDGPALHIFRPGIGNATIEYDFFVY